MTRPEPSRIRPPTTPDPNEFVLRRLIAGILRREPGAVALGLALARERAGDDPAAARYLAALGRELEEPPHPRLARAYRIERGHRVPLR